MKAQIKVTGQLIIEVEGDTQLELFRELSSAQEVFAHTACGACGETSLKYIVREDKEENEYVELHCNRCRCRLPFGQNKSPKGALYPKLRWDSLSDKEKVKRAEEEGHAKTHFGYLPNGGWYKYKPDSAK